MEPYQIHLDDWRRILIGEVPGGFFIELIIRTLFIYILLMISMRLMGKRMASQLGRNELIAMVSLAAAIGVPMMTPERGLLPCAVVAIVVVFVQWFVTYINRKSQKMEAITQDKLSILVSDGKMDLKQMKDNRITRERLFAQLRSSSVTSLGQVKRLYLEAGGSFSLVKENEAKPGLSILPKYDLDFQQIQQLDASTSVCNECGNQRKTTAPNDAPCERCGETQWKEAYL
ncbi:DUF421 domain-containing protein [Desertivirga brevis]|uniref:DUF421 domain-containing protein n=1 Tax=Desertivirga brevis TaxID=2810310 RepID=UPI001A978EFB|nr:YetF domain-containing protein [Pedobacter sp. SYSU D00873]